MSTAEATVRRPAVTLFQRRAVVIRAAEILIGGSFFLFILQVALGFNLFDPDLWRVYQRNYWTGIFRTIGYIALTLPVSVGLGFLLGWARVSRFRTFAWPATVYIEFFRGMPPIVIVIFASVLLPNLFPERLRSAELGLILGALSIALHSAAFQAEIFRAGFQSVPTGQVEAALAVGLEPLQSMRYVILPQALRLSVPPLSNEFAVLIKDTSLMAIIAGGELFNLSFRVQDTLARTGGELRWLFVIWTSVAMAYFVMTFFVTRVMRLIELRYRARVTEGISV
jgi:His/Glu/Gln/Arg/opine family amino acid ABC transporter permease subunit